MKSRKKSNGFIKGCPKLGRVNTRGSDFKFKNKSKDCLVNGEGCGHSSHQCKILMDHAVKVKGHFKAQVLGAKAHKKPAAAKPWNNNN